MHKLACTESKRVSSTQIYEKICGSFGSLSNGSLFVDEPHMSKICFG